MDVPIPSDAVNFTLANGQSFTLNTREFLFELADMHKATIGNATNGDIINAERDYYRAISARVAELNPGVLLNLGEADCLATEVGRVCAKKKRLQAESIEKELNSAFSMASTASDSPKRN